MTAAEAEIGYYQGEGLLLEDLLREQVLLAVPLKVICREDCKGLCPHCGKNLNEEGACSCADELEDPRWAALKEIRSKLNQWEKVLSSQFSVLRKSAFTENRELRTGN